MRISDTGGRRLGPGDPGSIDPRKYFGNQKEEFAPMPGTLRGIGGMADPTAGQAEQAAARAVDTVREALDQTATYFDNLRGAEESGRADLMMLQIKKSEVELRNKLDADPEYTKLPTAEQQRQFEIQRDSQISTIRQEQKFSHKQVVRALEGKVAEHKMKSSLDYQENVVKPRVLEHRKLQDFESNQILLDTVAANPTPEAVREAGENIVKRYTASESTAVYGDLNAKKELIGAVQKLHSSVLSGYQTSLDKSPIAKLDGDVIKPSDMDEKAGRVGLLVADQKTRFDNIIAVMPGTEAEKNLMRQKVHTYVEAYAKKSANDHNQLVKQEKTERAEALKDNLDTWSVQFGIAARQGQLSEKQAFSEFQKLLAHPAIVDDPQAQKKAYLAYDKVSDEIAQQRRHAERLNSERKTRETLAQYRMSNGVAVSGAALDQVWTKNKLMDSYLSTGVLAPAHIADIERAGAVPTSVMGRLEGDLKSNDPARQAQAIQNLRTLRASSAQTRNALNRDLPDGWSGVLDRVENGQSYKEAIGILTRPQGTPDEQRRWRHEAREKKTMESLQSWVKDIPLGRDRTYDLSKMNDSAKEQMFGMWEDAMVRARGDKQLARSFFEQDVSKNTKMGVNEFNGVIERYPLSRFMGSKDAAQKLLETEDPTLKGKELYPVYAGEVIVQGQKEPVPGYEIYVKNDKGGWDLHNDGRPFVATKERAEPIIRKLLDDDENKKYGARETKENQRYWENKKPNPITSGRAPKPTAE